MTDQSRIEFEAWAFENGMAMHLARAESGLYVSRVTQNYMDCWMGSRAEVVAENKRLDTINTQLILLECHGGTAQAAINLLAERDQLKAEVETLRHFIFGFTEYDAEMAHAYAAMSKEAGHD
jgi:hypothetical protein